jgi:hypothetical protein
VLELGQQSWLLVSPGRDLEYNEAICQISLSSQVHTPKSASSENLEQVKAQEIRANPWLTCRLLGSANGGLEIRRFLRLENAGWNTAFGN